MQILEKPLLSSQSIKARLLLCCLSKRTRLLVECSKHVPVQKPAVEPYPSHPILSHALCGTVAGARLAAQLGGTAFHALFSVRARLCFFSVLLLRISQDRNGGEPPCRQAVPAPADGEVGESGVFAPFPLLGQ